MAQITCLHSWLLTNQTNTPFFWLWVSSVCPAWPAHTALTRAVHPHASVANRDGFRLRGNIYTLNSENSFIPMAQQPLVGLDPVITEASRSHSNTPHSVGLLWTGDQPDTEAFTCLHSDTPHLVGLLWTGDQPDTEVSACSH
jgi:hypothetical protein